MTKIQGSLWALVLILASTPAFGQFAQRSSITGTVTDQSGAVVPDARVTLTDLDQSKATTAHTDKSGQYSFTQLSIGRYQVKIEQPGFQPTISNPIELTTQQNAKFDFTLQPGTTRETVEVTSAEPLVELDRASVDQNISFQQIQSLPISGRNFTSLAALAPSIATIPQDNVNPGGTYNVGANHVTGGIDYSAGGQIEGSRDNGYYVNGVNTTENYQSRISYAPSPDAISEARIAISDFSAANGHDITTFNVSTRPGTNLFHGAGYDYMENDILNARRPYDEAVGLFNKPTLRRNQFGGNLGGPVYIPKFYNKLKDRAFFFASYEQWLERDGLSNTTGLVPSAAERNGDFSELCTAGFSGGVCADPTQQLYNPYSTIYDSNGYSRRPPILNNQLPKNLIDPKAAALASIYPLPNTVNANGFNYVTSAKHNASTYRFDSRYDYRISDKNNVFVTLSKSHGTDNNSGGLFPQFQANLDDRAYLMTVNDAHIFTPHLTNEFIFGIGDGSLTTVPPSQLASLNSSSNPFNQAFANTGTGLSKGVMALNLYNYSTPGYNEIFRAENKTFQISDNVSWVHGRHNFTFGMNYFRKGEEDWDLVRSVSFGCTFSVLDYSCGKQAFTQAGTLDNSAGGDAFADLLLGLPRSIHQRYQLTGSSPTAPELNVYFRYWGFYANDRLQLTKRFTLSLGLRNDLIIPIYASNKLCCALVNSSIPGGELQIPGIAPGVPQHFLSARKGYFAPRVSLAYQIGQRLVFRAGYGLFYDAGASQISGAVGNALNGIPGYFTGDVLNNARFGVPDDTPYLHLSNVYQPPPVVAPGTFPVSLGPGTGYFADGTFQDVYTFDKQSTVAPRYHRFLSDFQYQLKANSVVTLEYLGAQGRNGTYYAAENLPPYQVGWPSQASYNAARPNNVGRFGNIYVLHPGLSSYYNAAVVKFEQRMSHGLSVVSNCSFGKTISDRNGWNYHLALGQGEASLSHRHRFLFSAVYAPSYGQGWNRIVRAALGGWSITTITTLESGNTYSANNGTGTSAADYDGPDVLNIIAGANPNISHFDKSFSKQFNTAAFTAPDNFVKGNSAPGIIRGPGQLNSDVSAAKTFSITERLKLDFRSELINTFNHPQWTGISTVYPFDPGNDVPFGQVESSREGRIIQLSGKLRF